MNFDDALRHYLPQVWFRFRFSSTNTSAVANQNSG